MWDIREIENIQIWNTCVRLRCSNSADLPHWEDMRSTPVLSAVPWSPAESLVTGKARGRWLNLTGPLVLAITDRPHIYIYSLYS